MSLFSRSENGAIAGDGDGWTATRAALGRQRAHDVVYDCCREALGSRQPFVDILAAHPDIAPVMTREELAAVIAPERYLGAAPEMVDRLLAKRK